MIYGLDNDTHPIRLTSDTGKTITVTFAWNRIYLNGTAIYSSNTRLEYRTLISGTVTKTGNTVTCQIAGFVNKTITVSNFSKLKYVNILVEVDNGYDTLNGLNIGSN